MIFLNMISTLAKNFSNEQYSFNSTMPGKWLILDILKVSEGKILHKEA